MTREEGTKETINGPVGSGESAGSLKNAGAENDCRCKDVSNMSPRQLLGLMMRDLAFWKKKGAK